MKILSSAPQDDNIVKSKLFVADLITVSVEEHFSQVQPVSRKYIGICIRKFLGI